MTASHELTLRLETVTPLFMSGAEPRAFEWRPAPFRGALRYWFRALHGGVVGGDVEAVRRAEAAVFGSAGEDTAAASAVTVRVRSLPFSEPRAYQPQGRQAGRDYLFWSMAQSGNALRGNFQEAKQFLAAPVAFTLQLLIRPGVRDPQRCLREAAAALWLLVHLGGVGSRARRTGGSLSVTAVQGEAPFPYILRGRTPAEFAQQLKQGLRQVRSGFGMTGTRQSRPPPDFDVLEPPWCRVWVLGRWDGADSAVQAIGEALRDFRASRRPDRIALIERVAFGLPLPAGDGGVEAVLGNDTIARRSSPLWLKVSKSADGSYFGVATLFKSRFLPEGARLRGRNAQADAASRTDYSLVERFIATQFPEAQEVKYG